MLRDNWLKWFERRIQLGRLSSRRRRSGKRLQVTPAWVAEALEERTLLTTFTVDNLIDESDGNFDPGDLSLREAIEQANASPGADVVQFSAGLGGSVIDLTLGNLNVTDDLSIVGFTTPVILNNAGLVLQSSGAGDILVFTMTGVGVNNSGDEGLLLQSTLDGFITANISNSFFNNSDKAGIRILAHTGGDATLTLSDVDVNSNGDAIASAGISVDVGVTAQAESISTPGVFSTVKLNMTDVQVLNNALEGLDVEVATGGRFETTSPITNTTFAGNGQASTRNEVNLTATDLDSSIEARFENVTANNAQASGFNFVGTAGANLAIVINNSSATGAGADAFNLLITGAGTSAAVSMDNFVGDGAGLFGVDVDVQSGAEARFNNFNNISLQNTGRTGLDVNLLGGDMTAFNATTVNVSGNTEDGAKLSLRDASSVFTFNGLTSNNNVQRAMQITSIVGANSSVTLNNVSFQGSQTKQPLNIVVNNNATLNLDVNGGTITSAGTDPNNSIFTAVKQNSTGNLSFDGLTVNNSTSSAFVTRYDTGSSGNYEITNTTATGSQAVGMALFVLNGSQVTGNFDGLDVSNSGQGITADAIRIDVNGLNTTADFTFNNITANGASKRGIGLQYANKSSGSVTQFDGISAQNAQQDGVFVEVRGLADLNAFNANGVNVTGAGQSGNIAHDGLELSLLGSSIVGTTASVNIQNLTANGAAGRAINVSVQNQIVADVVVDTFSANNSGLQGLNLVVGTITPGAVLQNSAFRNGSFTGNGTTGMFDGVRTRVTGAGSSADVNFNNVSADGNSLSGLDAMVDAGGDLTLGIENGSTASNNFLGGVRFIADGATTTAALTSTADGSAFINNNDTGFFVLLTNGVTVSDVTILGGASVNREHGVHIDANDGSGVTINNLMVGGTGAAFVNNDETGLLIELDGILGLANLTLDGVTANGNLGVATGVSVSIANMTLDNVSLTNVSAVSNTGDGVRVTLDAVTVNMDVTLTGFNVSGNTGDGVELVLLNGTTITDTVSLSGSSSGNTGDGVKFLANDASGVSIGTLDVTGTSLTANGNTGNGLTLDFDAVAGIGMFDISGAFFSSNAGDQVKVTFANMIDPLDINLDDVTVIGPGTGTGTGDGIDLTIDATNATSLSMNRITATNNNGDGLKLSLLNLMGIVIPDTDIDVGTFDNNGANGIQLIVTSTTAILDITNSTFDLLGTVASASGNGANGMLVLLDDADLTMNTVDQITFNGNTGTGITIQGATPSTFTSGSSFTNNTITNNGSFGFRGIFNGGIFDIAIGSRTTADEGNLFDSNGGAGILLEMLQDSVGRMAIRGNTITNTSLVSADFLGDGILIRMLGTSNPVQATNMLTDGGVDPGLLIQDNTIGGVDGVGTPIGNAGMGINFLVEERSTLDGVTILDNIANNNGIDGLNFRRFDEVTVARLSITGNEFNSNGSNGTFIAAENDDATSMEVELSGNEMMMNGADGSIFIVNADAKITLDMQTNMIVGNADDGVEFIEFFLFIDDSRSVSGDIGFNTIADNGDRGIQIDAITGSIVITDPEKLVLHDNIIGAVLDGFGQVVIDGNGSTGVEINGGGTSDWINNQIIRNGRLVIADLTVGHGFDIQPDMFPGGGTILGFYDKAIFMDSNLILDNFQDGIEILNRAGTFQSTFEIEMVDNRVQGNVGRGMDVLNQLAGATFITAYSSDTSNDDLGNFFSSNGEEGIYAVNTASNTQNQDDGASDTLAADGPVANGGPVLSLVIDGSTISNNGSAANIARMLVSAGLVVRVGTAGEGDLLGTPFDFATLDFESPTAPLAGTVTPTFVNPGVFLHLTRTESEGNFGDDMFIHGYTSTVPPSAIAGTWSDTEFAPEFPPDAGDPLARLDFYMGNTIDGNENTFDSLELNNLLDQGTPQGDAGAYYDNADGTFKSRLGSATPPGPFGTTQADRRRNAQRTGARTYPDGSALNPDPTTSGAQLSNGDLYGSAATDIGGGRIAIGATGDGAAQGAVYIHSLNTLGLTTSTLKLASGLGGLPILAAGDQFGSSITALGDQNGDGIGDIAVGAAGANGGEGAMYILFLNADGTVLSSTVIDSTTAGLPALDAGDNFGVSVAALGDLDGAGPSELALAVGASGHDTAGVDGRGAVHILFLNVVGTTVTISTVNTITDGAGVTLVDGDQFGISMANVGDLNGDGTVDLAVGASFDDTGPSNSGAVYLLNLNIAGFVTGTTKIDSSTTNAPTLEAGDRFGSSITLLDDIDGDGNRDLAVGATRDGSNDAGGIHILFLNAAGTALDSPSVSISSGENGGPTLMANDDFGFSVTSLGDIDGDGTIEIAVGSPMDDGAGGSNLGAVYVLSLASDGTATELSTIGQGSQGTIDGGIFLYPGMGNSTFRVNTGTDADGMAIATELDFGFGLNSNGFIFDDDPAAGDFAPIESIFDINGNSFGSPSFGELPFGWGTY